MTLEILDLLQSPPGRRLLAEAGGCPGDPFAAQRLRRRHPELSLEACAAAVDLVRLRLRAATKFHRAEEMWLTAPLLEQSSGDLAAEHRAVRFEQWERVGDLCCGLGGDALALAARAAVNAVDRDPVAVALTRANAAAAEMADRVDACVGELPGDVPAVAAAWIDPGRRAGGRRTRRLETMSPSIAEVLSLRERIPHLGIKLSPATDDTELETALTGVQHEREFISVRGECRELALWTGALATGVARRATLLPGPQSLSGEPLPYSDIQRPGRYLLEPDAAVIRAGLVGNLARQLGAWPIDARLAYLSADLEPQTPFARTYRVDAPEPFSLKALAARLRNLEAGDVVLKTRGTAAEPEAVRQQLRTVLKHGRPDRRPLVFLTRLDGRAMMILGESIGPDAT